MEPQTETVADPPAPAETVQPEGQLPEPDPVQGEEEGKIEFGDPDDDEVSVTSYVWMAQVTLGCTVYSLIVRHQLKDRET